MVKTLLSSAGGVGSVPGGRAKIAHASQTKNQNIKQKQYCNKFNKELKMIQIFKNTSYHGCSAVVFPVFLVLLQAQSRIAFLHPKHGSGYVAEFEM